MKKLVFILITFSHIATAHSSEPSMPIRPGVWNHSLLDAQGRVDNTNAVNICESGYTDLWKVVKDGEQGEGCGKTKIAMPGDQITTDQDCEDDMGNPRTSITHDHSVYIPIRAGAGPVTAYKVIITSTTKSHLGKTISQKQETTLHQWVRPCTRKDDGKMYKTHP